jgi:hypothetical protein
MSGQGCHVRVSTIFVYGTPAMQNAANTVYEQKKAYDTAKNATVTGNTYKFKSDFERMQYLLGQRNRQTGGSGSYGSW